MAFKPGEYVGPYQVIEQLGQGGMATVYKAYHVSLDRYVALKVLHQAFNEDSTFISRFQREARVVARLEHPNIVPVYDYAEHEGRPYLVMKFIEGDTLKARMNAGMLATDEIENVVDAVGAALSHAHQQGVLHRDIKPSNVMISKDNVIYLTDFGLARIAQDGESTMSSDSIMGTPQYISPEQAMGKKDLDGKTDIYSFGVMLYEMVVGQVPFSADTPFSIIHDHIYTPLPLPRSINANVPESVQKVLLKALAKNSLDRYETIGELISAFRHAWVEAGVPVRGTNITMRPNTLKTSMVNAAATQTRSVGAAQPVDSAPVAAEKRFSWMWASVGFVVVLCFALGLIIVRNILTDSQGRSALPTSTPFVESSTSTPFAQEPPTVSSPVPGERMTPAIDEAMKLVESSPGDPAAHLQLSLAYWDAGLKVPCYEALAQAANLAGPNDQDFYLKAAEDFKIRDAWIPAAGMYMRLAAFNHGESMPEEAKFGLREAVYRAASEKDMPLFIFFERVDGFDLPFGYVVRGRYALYNGSLEDAKLNLANAEKIQPRLPEIHLLKAEIDKASGNDDSARIILTTLSSDLSMPEWVRNMAGEILETIE
ncbi:MAG: serine/threonine protein kinase [Anaerolineales bacterium]|nr:serine/threonine protein kinase [Anaerolineales bacterium]MCB9145185.1 serine/threonine protein kinase [Anaerolineales bacterium]